MYLLGAEKNPNIPSYSSGSSWVALIANKKTVKCEIEISLILFVQRPVNQNFLLWYNIVEIGIRKRQIYETSLIHSSDRA